MDQTGEYFGSPAQQALQRRAEHLWLLLRDDPRYSCHGRSIALSDAGEGSLGRQVALARILGVGACHDVPETSAGTRRHELEDAGLKVDEFAIWSGTENSLAAADIVLAERALPGDLTVVTVDAATPSDDLRRLDTLTRACEVLLPMGSFLRGRERPAVCLYASDADGRVVGASAAVAENHPDHPKGAHAWWGMLSTDPGRRGQGIALIMGALSLRAMNERFGTRNFYTGIRDGNVASERLCAKLGLSKSDHRVVIGVDPEALPGGRVTK